jgi:hypothetical protein
MPSTGLVVANGSHDAGRFQRLDDHHDFVGACSVEVGIDEVIAAALWFGEGWCTALEVKLGIRESTFIINAPSTGGAASSRFERLTL